ncbi:MAG: SHOCT domain-containing protein [Collinsella sp.]|uniref:SHOCT domain-containing protein n=1 Tax=Collinsella aerofaciens TaxID=74426 RepID=UPI00319DBBB8|nr:SHOCT domain-containing protein [Collinsella sp.]
MSDSRTFSETTNHIKELKLLLDQGILSQDEYEQQKNALLFPDGLPTPTAEAQPQQALKASQNSDEKTTTTDSPAEKKNTSDKQFDEIIAFKKLLENGVITQDEFNQKKEELLGISPSTPSQKKTAVKPTIKILVSIIIAFAIAFLMALLLGQSYRTSAFIAPGFLGSFIVVFLLIHMAWK